MNSNGMQVSNFSVDRMAAGETHLDFGRRASAPIAHLIVRLRNRQSKLPSLVKAGCCFDTKIGRETVKFSAILPPG